MYRRYQRTATTITSTLASDTFWIKNNTIGGMAEVQVAAFGHHTTSAATASTTGYPPRQRHRSLGSLVLERPAGVRRWA
jgi:hypothetical protein